MKRLVLTSILALGLALPLAACGGDSGGGGSSGASGPEGTWVLDQEAFVASMKSAFDKQMEGKSGPELEMMKGFIGPMLEMFKQATISVTINGDGTWTSDSVFPKEGSKELEPDNAKGTWTLDGDKLTMTTTERGGKTIEAGKEVQSGTIDGDTLTVKGDGKGDPDIVLHRK